MWEKTPNGSGIGIWQNALTYCANLNVSAYAGYTDWRLPNIRELTSLSNVSQSDNTTWLNSQGFSSVGNIAYWSATTNGPLTWAAMYLAIVYGNYGMQEKANGGGQYVWACRGGQ